LVAAEDNHWEPEWVIVGSSNQATSTSYDYRAATQLGHIFGQFAASKVVPVTDDPWYWAVKETVPDFDASCRACIATELYRELLLLASGIQMAGPNLTPENFAAALQRTRFPNPGAGRSPYWQGAAGFGPGDFSMMDDVALVWLDRANNDNDGLTEPKAWCFIDRGARWRVGGWEKRDYPFQDRTKPCR
jgi:hypothetical protein